MLDRFYIKKLMVKIRKFFRSFVRKMSQTELDLFRTAIRSGNTGFLVLYCKKFYWAILCLDSLAQNKLSFFLNGNFPTEVQFSDVVLPGKPGTQRTLFVVHPQTKKIIAARFIGYHSEVYYTNTNIPDIFFKFCVRVTNESLVVPMSAIVPNFHTKYALDSFDALMAEKIQADAEAQKDLERRMVLAQVQTRLPMALPKPENNPVVYPFFNDSDLKVLFLLCKILSVSFKRSYEFNLLVIRFLACGSQERFVEDLPVLVDSDESLIRLFVKDYNQFFMGYPMTSQTLRCSKISVQQVFLEQAKIAKALRITSQCALSLPPSYFTDPEPEVELRKGPHDLIAHSSLEKLE